MTPAPQGLVDAIRSALDAQESDWNVPVRVESRVDGEFDYDDVDCDNLSIVAAQAAHQWMLQAAEPLRAMGEAAAKTLESPWDQARKWDYRRATNSQAIADLCAALGLGGEAG